jgi:tetratricopeptide (TPR) repeat protein/transcriptional regulator with XRE-family HTH domain
VAEPPVTFAGLLRRLRLQARMTQEELAGASGVSLRSVSDLERGRVTIPQKETVRLLADALHLIGPARAQFEEVGRGHAAPGGVAAATRALPRDIASFTGRQRELEQLAESASGPPGTGGVVSIHAIGGMAGVGKTAFAVHAAHQLADRFPGGQIFLPLHGHTPGQQPVDPEDALASLLLTIGVPAGQIPPEAELRMALWRDQLAAKQLLLVLDDAASSEQVRPLLPGAGGSLVLVTSRRHLSALDDATSVSLDTLPPGEAAALLVRLANRPGLSPADPAVAQITGLCGYLPLAIGLVARQVQHHPAWSLARRAAELASQRDRLELMATENVSVAAAFDLSYADLTRDQQRLFRRLGLHPGADIDAYAAAALDGTDAPAARRGLEALYDQYLLTEPTQGRYRLHDLIREHARALADRVDQDSDRGQATARLLDYYQQAAARADALITRQTHTAPAPPPAAPAPAALPALAGREQALAWARTERASLLACLDLASRTGQHARVTALTAGLAGLWRREGPWADAIARHTTAIHSALQIGDRQREANARYDLGVVRRLTGDFPAAAGDLEQALDIYRDLKDRLSRAHTLRQLAAVRLLTGDYPAATGALEQALDIYRDLGDRLGEANALNYLGDLWRHTGDFPAATGALEQALDIYRDLGDQIGQADCLNELGAVWLATGDYLAAAQAQERAMSICRDLGDRRGQADALSELGAALSAMGDYLAAARALGRALSIYGDLGDRGGEAKAINKSGTLYRVSGHLAQAERYHQQALELARAIASSSDEAHALAGLGRCASANGDAAQAETLLRQALEIFQRIGAAEAPDLRAELDAVTERPAGPDSCRLLPFGWEKSDGYQAASARSGGTVRQPRRVTRRHRRSDQRVCRLRRQSGVRPPRHPRERLDGPGHRGEARRGQDRLSAAPAGFPVTPGLRLRRPAAAGPAEDRGHRQGVPVVLRQRPGREVDADLGARDHALAGLASAAPSRAAPAVARRAGQRDREVVCAAA